MTTAYPGTLDTATLTTPQVDNVDDVMAADVNNLQDSILAIETELGTDPAGTATDLKTRLAVSLSGAGYLQFAATSTLTISSGSITPTKNVHAIDTEGAASTDDLATITGTAENWLLILHIVADARHVVLKHNTGNIQVSGGQDAELATVGDLAFLIYDAPNTRWLATCIKGAGMLGGANTWTGENIFIAALRTKLSAVNANTTLDATYQTVGVNAAGGAITITLPAAAGCTGRRYDIKKTDSSANVVTIDGNSAETIDGAATYVLSNQYSSVTIISNGSSWWII